MTTTYARRLFEMAGRRSDQETLWWTGPVSEPGFENGLLAEVFYYQDESVVGTTIHELENGEFDILSYIFVFRPSGLFVSAGAIASDHRRGGKGGIVMLGHHNLQEESQELEEAIRLYLDPVVTMGRKVLPHEALATAMGR